MTDDLVKRLRSQIGDDVQEVYLHEPLFALAADRIEALTDQLEDAYARGFCAGQRALKDVGKLVIIDDPKMLSRIEALTALVCEADDLFRGDLTGLQWKRECREFRVKARAALTGNVTVGGGWVDWGASFLPAVPTGKETK